MNKDTCTHFARGLLLRAGYLSYTPDFVVDYDLLIYDQKTNEYKKVYIAKVSDGKPIISMKTSRAGVPVVREFDLLIAIHPSSLSSWMIPVSDLPEVESLYLSKKYDDYQTSLISPRDIDLHLDLKTFNNVREAKQKNIEELKQIEEQYNEENTLTMDDVLDDILGD